MLQGLVGYAHTVVVLLPMGYIMIHERAALSHSRQQYAALFSTGTDTTRSFFAQQGHMPVSTLFWIILTLSSMICVSS